MIIKMYPKSKNSFRDIFQCIPSKGRPEVIYCKKSKKHVFKFFGTPEHINKIGIRVANVNLTVMAFS